MACRELSVPEAGPSCLFLRDFLERLAKKKTGFRGRRRGQGLQGHLAHKKQLPPLGPPQGRKHSSTVGSQGGTVSCERGIPVLTTGVGQGADAILTYYAKEAARWLNE